MRHAWSIVNRVNIRRARPARSYRQSIVEQLSLDDIVRSPVLLECSGGIARLEKIDDLGADLELIEFPVHRQQQLVFILSKYQ